MNRYSFPFFKRKPINFKIAVGDRVKPNPDHIDPLNLWVGDLKGTVTDIAANGVLMIDWDTDCYIPYGTKMFCSYQPITVVKL